MHLRKPGGEHGLARGVGAALAACAIATLICFAMYGRFDTANLSMVYLLAVAAVASRFGRVAAAIAAVVNVLAFDILFVPPRFTLEVEESQYLVTFLVMLAVGFLISSLGEQSTQARQQAETEKIRNSLLTSISHDLRTPLAAIAGAASSLKSGKGDHQGLAETIYEESMRLNLQVQNLLDMTRLQSGQVPLRRQWHSMEELVGSALQRTSDLLEDRPVTVNMPPELPLVECDGELMEKVITNLIENVAAHTPKASDLEISAREGKEHVILDVADRGSGIPKGQESRIFERFLRHADGEAASGFGLGLAICRAILKLHEGHIWAENRPQGAGAVFHVELPKHPQPVVPLG